jgi:D-alanyl-lipoteichoic acid acyltransferase DltB (MBOAT superfamily)
MLSNKNRNNLDIVAAGKNLPSIKEFIMMLATFTMTTFAWIFFRAPTINDALQFIKGIFRFDFGIQYISLRYNVELLLLVFLFILVEWVSRMHQHPVHGRYKMAKALLIITGILMFGVYSNPSDFIYFQF